MMPTAVEQLKVRLRGMSLDEWKQRYTPAELAEFTYTLQDAKCAERVSSFGAGPLYWLTSGLTNTENPQHADQDLPFRYPFPKKSYFLPLLQAFFNVTTSQPLFVIKSRTLMTSWLAMGFATWAAQWERSESLVQTLNEDRCIHLIDYVRQLWDNQPEWLKQRHPLVRRSAFSIQWQAAAK